MGACSISPSNFFEKFGPSLFGAGVRLIGLVLILDALYWAFYGFLRAAGIVVTEIEPFEYILATIAFCIAGVVLIRWAPVFVALAYREDSRRERGDAQSRTSLMTLLA